MGWGSAIGGAIGGALGLIGAGQSQVSAERLNRLNYEHQKEFAQNGIRWRVADAKAAGLHPLAALGAQGASYSPSAVIGDSPDYSFLKDMGQGIDRAMDAKTTQKERAEKEEKSNALFNEELKGKQLQNQETETRIQQMKWDMAMDAARNAERSVRTQQQVPPMPSLAPDGSLMPGQSNATSPGDIIDAKPPEVTLNAPGRPNVEAASINELAFSRTGDGGYAPVMSTDAKNRLEEDIVGTFGWNMRNRAGAWFDLDGVKPPKSWLPPGAIDFSYSFDRGAWYPVFPD
jgi:hypothetical protein